MATNPQVAYAQKAAAQKQAQENQAQERPRLIDEKEAAFRLGLKVATLRRWRWAGKPPNFLKIGSAVRYDPEVLAAFREACQRTSTSDVGKVA